MRLGRAASSRTDHVMLTDIHANRSTRKWSRGEQVGRVLWALARPAFRFSPRIFWGWRRGLLRRFGASIGDDVHVHPTVRVAIPWHLTIGDLSAVGDGVNLYSLGPIGIGKRCTVSQGAHLCAGTHDHRRKDFPLVKAPITIGDDVWICAEAFIGPGVRVGDFAIVAARSVVMRDVAASTVVAGHPASRVGDRPAPV